jgi:succinate-semialdehyde dehydrogenase/glutarate-semialdehyde dehydrogenase
VAARAGQHLKKVVLELGGSDPFIVMPSADVDRAADVAVQARLLNNGQSCIAAKRFVVHEAVYERFAARFVEGMERLRVGDPLDPETQVGPLATPGVLADLEDQVARSLAMGARLLTGGRRLPGPGNYYMPTVLADLPAGAAAACEETFGPVAALFRVATLEEALRTANDTPFGLGASAWTTDPAEQQAFVAGLEAGQVFINSMVFSDPRLPFGGVKSSGFGRELGEHGLREFLHTKTVWIQ